MGGRRSRALAATIVLAALVAGCGEESQVGSRAEPSGPAPRFRLTSLPDGYELVLAERGTSEPFWASDCCGSDEHVLVLGEPDHDDPTEGRLIVVSAFGYQVASGFDGSARGPRSETLTVAGRRAHYTPTGSDPLEGSSTAQVVVDHGNDTAVRVSGPGVSRDELVAVAERVTVVDGPGQTARPVVADPPEGRTVLSEASTDLAVAVSGTVLSDPRSDDVPGTDRSFAVAYRQGRDRGVLAVSLPGGADDLLAARSVARHRYGEARSVQVDGRPGVELSGGDSGTAIVFAPDGGGLIALRGEGLTTSDLEEVAAGVEAIDEAAWEAQVVEARGGPGLRPDRGAVELARGEADGAGWLLQAAPPGPDQSDDFVAGPRARQALVVDPCLRLANGQHACRDGGASSADLVLHFNRGNDGDRGPPFVSGMVPPDVTRVRVRGRGGTVEVDTVAIPDREERAFVAIVDGLIERRESVELLDGDGTVVDQESSQ